MHEPGGKYHKADEDESKKPDAPIQAQQKQEHDGFGEDVTHHIGQSGHAVFLNEYHIGGQNGTDLSDIAFRKIAHGNFTKMLSQFHAFVRKYHEAGSRLQAIRHVLKDNLQN